MSIFQRKDRTQELIENEILFAVSAEREALKNETAEFPECGEIHCKNIKLLAEAYAAINGW